MMLLNKARLAGLSFSVAMVLSSTALADTISSDTTATKTTNADGVMVIDATGAAVTLDHAGGSNEDVITFDDTTSTDNQLTVSGTTYAATVASTGGTGAAVAVAQDSVTATTVGGFGINIGSNGFITKSGAAAGDAMSIGADVSIANSGTIQATNASNNTAIDITAGETILYNTGNISATADLAGNAVIQVDSGATLNLVNLNGGTISSASGSDDIVIDVNGSLGTFYNYGNITSNGTGAAIDVAGDTAASTLVFGAGTVTGDIVLGGTLSDTIQVTSSTVALNGDITGDSTKGGKLDIDSDFAYKAAGSGTISNITEIDVADGKTFTLNDNTINNSAATLKDLDLTGAGSTDIRDADSADAIDLGTGTLTVGASHTLVTDVDSVVDVDAMSLSGTVSGTLALDGTTLTLNTGATTTAGISGTTAGAEALTIAGGAYTASGIISEIDTINVTGGNLTSSYAITKVDTLLDVDDGRTFTANANVDGAGTLTLDGTLNIASGVSVTMGKLTAASGAGTASATYVVNTSSSTASRLVLTDAAATSAEQDFSGTVFEVVLDSGAQIADGATRTVVQGSSTAASLTAGVVSFTNAILTASVTVSGEDLLLTFDRANSYNSLATNDQTTAVGSTLEALVGSATGDLATVVSQLDSMTSAAAVAEALETLTPTMDGLGTASLDIQTAALDTVANRLAYLRYGDQGIATGDGTYTEHMWMQAFGSVANQGERNGVAGFEASGYGLAIGFDSSDIFEDALAGFSVAYSSGDVDGKSAADAQTDLGSYMLNGYYSRDLQDDMYVDGMIGLAYNTYETARTVNVGSFDRTAKGDFDGWQVSGRAAIGRHYDMGGNFQLIPEASAQYTYLTLDKYTETGAGGANLTVDADDNSSLVLALGGTAAWDFEHAGGSVMRAELRGKYTYDMIGDELSATSTFAGGGASFKTDGAKVAQHGVVLGAGMKLLDAAGMEFGIDYDATLKADYVNHSGQLKVRWAF